MEPPCSSSKITTKIDPDLKPLKPLVCKNIEETLTCQNMECGPFGIDTSFGSKDGRFMYTVEFQSISVFDTYTAKTWRLANESINLIFGFILTGENYGILLYSTMQLTDFVVLREMLLAKVYLNFEKSQIEINEVACFASDNLIKQMYGTCNSTRFVLLSEISKTLDNSSSTFYIYSTNDITRPLKTLKVDRVNDKILFYNLIGNYLYYFDTPQVSLFEDVLFNKSLIRKLSIKSGEVETVQTSEFPDCGNFIAYGNRPWCINGKWSERTLYLSVTLPYSDPEVHLFFSFNIDSKRWRQILIEGIPCVRSTIIRPTREQNRMYFLLDDRAALIFNVVNNHKLILIQPRTWDHKEFACFTVMLNDNPESLKELAKHAVLNKWPEIADLDNDEKSKQNLPINLL